MLPRRGCCLCDWRVSSGLRQKQQILNYMRRFVVFGKNHLVKFLGYDYNIRTRSVCMTKGLCLSDSEIPAESSKFYYHSLYPGYIVHSNHIRRHGEFFLSLIRYKPRMSGIKFPTDLFPFLKLYNCIGGTI